MKEKVYMVYHNQYINRESAQYIIDNHGNHMERVIEVEYNQNEPLFIVEDNKQIELEVSENGTFVYGQVFDLDELED